MHVYCVWSTLQCGRCSTYYDLVYSVCIVRGTVCNVGCIACIYNVACCVLYIVGGAVCKVEVQCMFIVCGSLCNVVGTVHIIQMIWCALCV